MEIENDENFTEKISVFIPNDKVWLIIREK